MAAKIRLKKVGRRGQPSYRVVVLDGRKPRDAKVVADLGHYDPKTNPATFEIDGDEALKWLLEGAKATKAARDILSLAGVMAAWDAAKRGEAVEIEAKELKPTTKSKKAKADEGPSTEGEIPVGADEGPSTEGEIPVGADEGPSTEGEIPVGADQEPESEPAATESEDEAPSDAEAAKPEPVAVEEDAPEDEADETEEDEEKA